MPREWSASDYTALSRNMGRGERTSSVGACRELIDHTPHMYLDVLTCMYRNCAGYGLGAPKEDHYTLSFIAGGELPYPKPVRMGQGAIDRIRYVPTKRVEPDYATLATMNPAYLSDESLCALIDYLWERR